MEKSILGRTGLEVTRLGMGGAFVVSRFAEKEDARDAVHRAVALGVNYVDTAPGYSNSEEVLGFCMEDLAEPMILSTKFGGRPQPFEPQSRDCLMQSLEESLRLLGRDYIDMLIVHEPERPGMYDWWTNWEDVEGPVLELLGELKDQGVIGHIGLGGTTAYEMAHLIRSGKFDVVLTAFNYSILWREAAIEVIPEAKKQNMGIIVGSPLQQGGLARCYHEAVNDPPGWLSKPRVEQLKKLYAFVDECGISLPELALRWVLSNRDVHTTLMGARSVEEVELNVAAAEQGALSDDILQRLDEIAAEVPFRPYGEPFGMMKLQDPHAYKGPGRAS
jgi:aryl-alcohol dehydrogenase-like predicted oxidoreductase